MGILNEVSSKIIAERNITSEPRALANKYHEKLKSDPLTFSVNLPYDISSLGSTYPSYSTCYSEAKSAISRAYEEANRYFDPKSKKSLAKECAKYYNNVIASAFKNKLPELEKLFQDVNKPEAYKKLCKLINSAKKKLKKIYNKELMEEAEFYQMYNFEYFMEQVEIVEMGNNTFDDNDDFLGLVLRAIFSESKEYMVSDLYCSIREMESDLADHASIFYNFAHEEYVRYIGKIEKVLDCLENPPS